MASDAPSAAPVAETKAELVKRLRPAASPDTFPAEAFDRLVSDSPRRIQWLVPEIRRRVGFGPANELNLSGCYMNLAMLDLLLRELGEAGASGPAALRCARARVSVLVARTLAKTHRHARVGAVVCGAAGCPRVAFETTAQS
jgi:hypothetical protein